MQQFMNGWIKVQRFFRFSLQHLWSDEELRQCKEFQSSVFGTLIEKTGTQSSRNSICSIGQQLRITVLLRDLRQYMSKMEVHCALGFYLHGAVAEWKLFNLLQEECMV